MLNWEKTLDALVVLVQAIRLTLTLKKLMMRMSLSPTSGMARLDQLFLIAQLQRQQQIQPPRQQLQPQRQQRHQALMYTSTSNLISSLLTSLLAKVYKLNPKHFDLKLQLQTLAKAFRSPRFPFQEAIGVEF